MPGDVADQELFARQLAEWARRMSAAAGVAASEGPTPREAGDASDRAERVEGATSDRLNEVPFRFMLSGFRLWARCAEVWMRLGLAVAQNVSRIQPEGGTSEEARSLLITELRSGLRELTAVSSQEARRLDAELEELVGRDRRDAPGDEPGPYWRRWEVKR